MQSLSDLRAGKLLGATHVKISENLKTFPQELFDLVETLEFLDLSHNDLSEMPADFYRFTKLKIAFFSFNAFREMPDVFKECHNLYMLGFKANR